MPAFKGYVQKSII